MRHHKSGRKLNRTYAHRVAMLENMITSLIRHERITTTHPKAKEARRMVEKVITLGKTDTLHSRRLAFRILQDETIVKKVFDVLGPRFAQRPGGYTRIMKVGFRHGDNAPMSILEFVERSPVEATPVAAKTEAAE